MCRAFMFLFVACFAPTIHAALEFAGYMRSSDGQQFVVTDLDSGVSSGWLTIGRVFQGYKVTAFDEQREVLVLEKDGERVRLPLKVARIRHGSTALAAKVELQVKISPDGTIMIGDQLVSFEAFEALLRKHAEVGAPLALNLHEPWDPGASVHATAKAIISAVSKSGPKKSSIKIVNAPPRKK